MKVLATLALLVSAMATVQAHTKMDFPKVRGDPTNPNTSVDDGPCLMTPFNGGPGCAPKTFPCHYPKDKVVTQTFSPGQVFNVKFLNQNNPPPSGDQARHNGGLCEFSLSYDNAQTFNKIATYHRTCPDMFFDWPVKIPSNAPSGDNVIFSWSWINAVGNREFYQNCADIKITGNNGGSLPKDPITMANINGFPIMTPPGDPANTGNSKGSGPDPADIQANTGGGSASSGAPSGGAPSGGAPSGGASSGGAPSGGAPSGGAPSGGNGGKKGGKKGRKGRKHHSKKPGKKPGKTAGGSTGSSQVGEACSPDGQFVCAASGQSSEYFICDHGKYVSRSCSDNQTCFSDPSTMIVCR